MTDVVDIIAQMLPGVSPHNAILLFMLIFMRFVVMTITMPFLGGLLVTSAVRIGVAALLSIICFITVVEQQVFVEMTTVVIVLLFIKEALIGFFIGIFASLIFYAYELVGELLDISRAASMSRLLVPELRHQSSAMGVLLFQLSLVVFIGFGFHRDVIEMAYQSFHTFPVLSLETKLWQPHVLGYCVSIMAVLFECALRFALPVVVVCFLIDLAFGLLNRVAPQINAYFLSLPAKMVGGLIIVFLVLPFLLDDFTEHYHELSTYLRGIVQSP